jgi:hypothetical protein
MSARTRATAIPPALATAIADAWPRHRVLAPHAERWGLVRQLFAGKHDYIVKPVPSAPSFAFWTLDDDAALEEFLFDGLLPAVWAAMEQRDGTRGLPEGYVPLARVLEFERHFQFESWLALDNHGRKGMARIIDAYRHLGLATEANGLTAALAAAAKVRVDDDAWYETLESAYRRATGQAAERGDTLQPRLVKVFAFVRANPQAFADA